MTTKTTTKTADTTTVPTYMELCLELINVEISLDRIAARQRRIQQQSRQDNAKLARILRGRSRQLNWKAEAIVNLLNEHYGVERKSRTRTTDPKTNVLTMPFVPKTAA
jgi:hypothetical protein